MDQIDRVTAWASHKRPGRAKGHQYQNAPLFPVSLCTLAVALIGLYNTMMNTPNYRAALNWQVERRQENVEAGARAEKGKNFKIPGTAQ